MKTFARKNFLLLVILGLTSFNSIWAAEQEPLYTIKFSKPYSVEETGEILKPDTPEEVVVVKGRRNLVYIGPTKGRVDYAVNEMNTYVADENGYRVKLKFKLVRLTEPEEKLGPKALMAAGG